MIAVTKTILSNKVTLALILNCFEGVSSNLGGTALYVNGLMAPDIYLERGRTYSFVIETGLGSDPDQTFHPVYITSDPTGGHQLKSDFEAKVS
jgi:hypothetical protein